MDAPPTDDFGGEPTPAPNEESNDDKPFDDEPFDAGVEADESTEPEKYIEQLSGKLGQSIRQFTEDNGQPDLELEKFAINSVISATHTSQMDEEDQKDIINKVKNSGGNDEDDFDSDKNSDMEDIDSFDGSDDGDSDGGNDGDDLDFSDDGLEENMDNLFVNPKKNNMFQPHSNDILSEAKLNIKMKLKETFKQEDSTLLVSPELAQPKEKKVISVRNRPFFPSISYNIDPDIESYE